MTAEEKLTSAAEHERGAVADSAEAAGDAVLAGPSGVRIRRAILSVHDKRGIAELARGLRELGVEILSTGGTARTLSEAGVELRTVSDYTGFPEIMDGRVKTLHPRLYGGILARRDQPAHLEEAAAQEIEEIDLVCVNLYPFEQTVAQRDVSVEEVLENIDIGGPTMIRAAAKNHRFVAVLVDPDDYEQVLSEMRFCGGRLPLATRERLAARAFASTARYDTSIYRWFAARGYAGFPPRWASSYEKVMDLRYGENPHQQAAFYAETGAARHLLSDVRQLHGKELSFNNLLDIDAARELIEELESDAARTGAEEPGATAPAAADQARAAPAAAVIIKHNNPCGCAIADSALEAYERAFASDPQSAFGGIIAVDRQVDLSLARAVSNQFLEVLLAPGFDEDALELLKEKQNQRLLELSPWPGLDGLVNQGVGTVEKPVLGGVMSQTRDAVLERREQMRIATKVAPSEEQWQDLLFAWAVCLHVRSNAIVLARNGATIGIGAGQMSRVDSVRIAVEKARASQEDLLAGCSLASDAYFPFADNVELAAEAGVAAVIQPGGSVRDPEVIAAADDAGLAMVFTDVRHFRH